tara:strand:+ start:377 stop:967 length:591 start_codon:yes stop_codon:yes gene_type:complete
MSDVTDGGTFQTGESPQEEVKERELCPNLITPNDLVTRIGTLSVTILNKEKVLTELWMNVDALSNEIQSYKEEVESLKESSLQREKVLSSREATITELGSSKEQIRKNQVKVEENFRLDAKRLRDENQIRIQNRDDKIQKLRKALDSIEAEAVVNQEEIRKELMEAQNELFSLKESLKSPKKVTKKKKTNAKPARA